MVVLARLSEPRRSQIGARKAIAAAPSAVRRRPPAPLGQRPAASFATIWPPRRRPPLPEPVDLAFAETLLDPGLPLPAGLAFHLADAAASSVAFVAVLRGAVTRRNALLLALALSALAVVVTFPADGCGIPARGCSSTPS